MRSLMKGGLAALVVLSLVSCTAVSPQSSLSYEKGKNYSVVRTSGNTYIADVGNGKKGAGFSIEIKVPESGSGFRTTANNTNGVPAKTANDIQTFMVYLIQNSSTTGYPPGGDPLGTSDMVSGPYILAPGGTTTTVSFANVLNSNGKAYYVAIRALDNNNTELIKANNGSTTAWTGKTAALNGHVAVSTGAGITVTSLVVSSNTALLVTPNLLDSVGATIQTNINPNSGSSSFPLVDGAILPPTGEFQVNTYFTGKQISPSAASDSAGDFVIAWQSVQDNGSGNNGGYGIYAKRYNAAGVAQGEFKVNTYTTNIQKNPSIAMDSAGDFVIAWQSNNQDGGGYGIYAQRYNASGTAQGNEFLVNTTVASDQKNPSVEMDNSGNFVIAWDGNGPSDSSGVFAQRYNADGTKPSTNGVEFKVNTTVASTQKNPSVGMDNAGDFIITWQSFNQDLFGGYGVYAQRYNADGSKPSTNGAEFKVNTYTTDTQQNASVAMDSNGDFVIAWQSYGQEGSPSSFGVFAQRYDVSGTAQGAEFKVNTYTTSLQHNPSVAARDSNGDFVIAWQSSGQDGNSFGIYAQRYNATGVTQGAEFKVNTYINLSQQNPSVAMDSGGDFIVTWEDTYQDGSNYGIYAKRYYSPGIPK
jgi:hypothetical protein